MDWLAEHHAVKTCTTSFSATLSLFELGSTNQLTQEINGHFLIDQSTGNIEFIIAGTYASVQAEGTVYQGAVFKSFDRQTEIFTELEFVLLPVIYEEFSLSTPDAENFLTLYNPSDHDPGSPFIGNIRLPVVNRQIDTILSV